jgi:hypothetical protein
VVTGSVAHMIGARRIRCLELDQAARIRSRKVLTSARSFSD